MAKKQSITTRAVKETPKAGLSPETAEAIATAKKDVDRFSDMMDGLNTFCMCIQEDGPEHEFAFAVGTLADLIQREAQNISAKLGKILEGGAE
jgi:hypothetical protein